MRVLVAGQGLAGTLISREGLLRNWDVQVLDAGRPSASSVAAGMYNPMSFRRIVEVWDARAHLDAMVSTYRDFEQMLGLQLLHPLPIYKRIPNAEYAREWNGKAPSTPWISEVMSASAPDTAHLPPSKDGYGRVDGGGWLNLPALITAWRKHLTALGRFTLRELNTQDELDVQSGHWDAVIDCRGWSAKASGIGPQLDIRANRGEILTLHGAETGPSPPANAILNFGKWTLPLPGRSWRLGASYEWNRTDLDPTPETADFLVHALSSQWNVPLSAEVVQHEAGLRPVSRDRRPAVGPVPGWKGWSVFNGLGTRGVLIGPRWAGHLGDILDGHAEPDPETDPCRLVLSE